MPQGNHVLNVKRRIWIEIRALLVENKDKYVKNGGNKKKKNSVYLWLKEH